MSETASVSDLRRVREDVIVDAAAQMFLKHGVTDVKMTDIANASGVGVASLYRYFGTKDNLVIAVGTLLWKRYASFFEDELANTSNTGETGIERMESLLRQYCLTFEIHPEYLSFLDEFDRLILSDQIDRNQLRGYDHEIGRFRPFYREAFDRGVSDGSIRADVDFNVFYLTSAHALIGIAQKLMRGEILPTEDFSHGSRELDCIVAMAIGYLRNEK